MSRLALLVGAVPSRCIEGPVVRLLRGHWILHVEGIVDSDLTLLIQGFPASKLEHAMEIKLDEPTDVMIDFLKRGTEAFINVFADRQ